MRRLLAIAALSLAAGSGAAVLAVGGGSPAVAAPRPAAHAIPRAVPREAPRAPLALAPAGQTCFVGSGGCSLHPCVQFVGSGSAATRRSAGGAVSVVVPAPGVARCARMAPTTSTVVTRPGLIGRPGPLPLVRGGSGPASAVHQLAPVDQALAAAQRNLARRLSRRAHR